MFEEVKVEVAAKIIKKPRLGRTPVAPHSAAAQTTPVQEADKPKEKQAPARLTIGGDPDYAADATNTGKEEL